MSPTIPILSALLLSLISGSTEGGQRMDSVALLRQTLRYWRKIYKTYHEEVMLGYCWADYLLEISDKLSANLSVTPSTAATGRRSNAKSQQKPFPRNVTVRETPHGDTRTARHSRSRTVASFTIRDHFINGPDEHRESSRSRMAEKRQRRTMNTTGRAVTFNGRIDDGNDSAAIDSLDGKR